MIITRRSSFSGEIHEMDLPVTEDELNRWENGEDLIQNIFPFLSDNEREFIMTGITQEEWDDAFAEEEE